MWNSTTLYQNRCVISFFSILFFWWYEERVQRVFQAIKVKCVYLYCRQHTNRSIQIYRSIRQKKENQSKKKRLLLPMAAVLQFSFVCCLLLLPLDFYCNVYFSRFTVLFWCDLDISWLNRYRLVPSEMFTCLSHAERNNSWNNNNKKQRGKMYSHINIYTRCQPNVN